jgi:5'-deoxynucleotidase
MSLYQAFRAGFVRRWHTNPELAHTNDRIDGHAGRVARIILMLHPKPSVALIRAALIHDDGESVVGDVSAPSKDKYPVIADALEEMEYIARCSIWGHCEEFHEHKWLKFADRLDAYMWAQHHAPHVMGGDGWPEARSWLEAQAIALGVSDHLCQTIGGM